MTVPIAMWLGSAVLAFAAVVRILLWRRCDWHTMTYAMPLRDALAAALMRSRHSRLRIGSIACLVGLIELCHPWLPVVSRHDGVALLVLALRAACKDPAAEAHVASHWTRDRRDLDVLLSLART